MSTSPLRTCSVPRPRPRHAAWLIALFAAIAPAAAQQPLELLLKNPSHYWFTVESVIHPTKWLEAADDFDLVADIHRVRASGHACWSCATGELVSARLAFYEWTPDGPGALQAEWSFAAGDPSLLHSPGPGLIDFQLPTPFVATGKHFLSVQVEVVGFWSWWCGNYGEPVGSRLYYRTEPDGPWSLYDQLVTSQGPANSDLAFELYGVDDTPPTAGSDPSGPWTVVPTPPPSEGLGVFLRDVDALADDDVWAVGHYSFVYAPPLGWKTLSWIEHWDGATWSFVPSPNPEPYVHGGNLSLHAVDAVSADDVWAAGTYRVQNPSGGSLGSQVFVVHWDGAAWSHVPAPMSDTGSGPTVNDILANGPEDVWFFGHWLGFQLSALGEQRALAMHWDGSSFTLTEPPFFDNYGGYGGGHSITSADGVAPDDIWAVGGAHGPDFTPHSYIVHWDGSSWTHVPGPTPGINNRLFAVEAIASDDVWASGAYTEPSGARKPLFLHWDGSTWTQVDAPAGGSTLLHRPATDDVISSAGIYGGEGIVRWDGVAWTPVMDFPTTTNPLLDALALVPGTGRVWGVGRQNGPDVGALTVRLDPPESVAQAQVLHPCAADAPPQSLLASPAPEPGASMSFAVNDPTAAAGITPGSTVLLMIAGPSDAPCGVLVPNLGPGFGPGELLVDAPIYFLLPGIWGGPDDPAIYDVHVPSNPNLLGVRLGAQAAFKDALTGDVVLTGGLLLTIGE